MWLISWWLLQALSWRIWSRARSQCGVWHPQILIVTCPLLQCLLEVLQSLFSHLYKRCKLIMYFMGMVKCIGAACYCCCKLAYLPLNTSGFFTLVSLHGCFLAFVSLYACFFVWVFLCTSLFAQVFLGTFLYMSVSFTQIQNKHFVFV